MTGGVEFTSIMVTTDGEASEGKLVLAEGALIAVLTRTPDDAGDAGSWYREAGFGPCSDLFTVAPPAFASLDEAGAWVRGRIDAQRASSQEKSPATPIL